MKDNGWYFLINFIVVTQCVAASSLTLPVHDWWCAFSCFGLHLSTNPLFLDERETQAWWHPKLQLQGVRDQLSVFHVSQFPFSAAEHCCLHSMRSWTHDNSAHLLQWPSPGSIHHLTTANAEQNQPKTDAVGVATKVFSSLGNAWQNRLWATWGKEYSLTELFT